MPKVHNIGKQWFVQVTRFPFEWGKKYLVKGWTQEIEEPFRTSEPYIFRLPKYHALVFGKWSGQKNEEEALNDILQRRDLTYEDFQEEKGWTPPPDENRKEGGYAFNPGPYYVGGASDVHNGETLESMGKASISR